MRSCPLRCLPFWATLLLTRTAALRQPAVALEPEPQVQASNRTVLQPAAALEPELHSQAANGTVLQQPVASPEHQLQSEAVNGTVLQQPAAAPEAQLQSQAPAPLEPEPEFLIVGAGLGGITLFCRLVISGIARPEAIRVVESQAAVGGVWELFQYPDIGVDIPGPLYMPLLEYAKRRIPEALPTSLFPAGEEIRRYAEALARSYGMLDRTSFNTSAVAAVLNETDGRWEVQVRRQGGGTELLRPRFLFLVTGSVHSRGHSRLLGNGSFKVLLPEAWDESKLQGENLTVGVVGTGPAAVQIVPRLEERPNIRKVYVFQRSAAFNSPKPNYRAFGLYRGPLQISRPIIEDFVPTNFGTNTAYWERASLRFLERTVHDEEVQNALRPASGRRFYCSRPTFSSKYYQVFCGPRGHRRVELVQVPAGVREARDGCIFVNGQCYAVDVAVDATGYEWAGMTLNPVGRGGRRFSEHTRNGELNLFGVNHHGFPNLFRVGPQTADSVLTRHFDRQVERIVKQLDTLLLAGLKSVEATQAAVRAFSSWSLAEYKSNPYISKCTSWTYRYPIVQTTTSDYDGYYQDMRKVSLEDKRLLFLPSVGREAEIEGSDEAEEAHKKEAATPHKGKTAAGDVNATQRPRQSRDAPKAQQGQEKPVVGQLSSKKADPHRVAGQNNSGRKAGPGQVDSEQKAAPDHISLERKAAAGQRSSSAQKAAPGQLSLERKAAADGQRSSPEHKAVPGQLGSAPRSAANHLTSNLTAVVGRPRFNQTAAAGQRSLAATGQHSSEQHKVAALQRSSEHKVVAGQRSDRR